MNKMKHTITKLTLRLFSACPRRDRHPKMLSPFPASATAFGMSAFFTFIISIGSLVSVPEVVVATGGLAYPPAQTTTYQTIRTEDASLMNAKAYGTCWQEIDSVRWSVDKALANQICCNNRHYAEHATYWEGVQSFVASANAKRGTNQKIDFYDPIDGSLLFRAPVGRTMEDFLAESKAHGWPSFRDAEVVNAKVRVLEQNKGEVVTSTTGLHLGHNLPDSSGNRYCINLVCVAGVPNVGASSPPPSEEQNNTNQQMMPSSANVGASASHDASSLQAGGTSSQNFANRRKTDNVGTHHEALSLAWWAVMALASSATIW
ncbi:unnamed protein product [Amoebophrya sp. A25]|nr:unnamed protein product [Amoebophrya sp. A25]|eukprot:GSA25T00025096001.1